MGDFQRGVADIGWANLFVLPSREAAMDFSDWYLVDPSCFMIARKKPYSGIYSLIFPLDGMTWFLGLMSVLVVAAFYGIHARSGLPSPSFDVLVMFIAQVALKESDKLANIWQTNSLRFLETANSNVNKLF